METVLLMEDSLAVWEGEGGALSPARAALDACSQPEHSPAVEMTGTVNQIEWAVRIKKLVNAEFDRVARALKSAAAKQTDQNRAVTQSIIAILEEKRSEVMSRTQAGYFIHDWQELNDQVRQMIVRDPRYLVIKSSKTARQR